METPPGLTVDALLREVIAAVPVSVYVLDRDGRI
jgi:hypothetical protein